jgi:hypothetical protein
LANLANIQTAEGVCGLHPSVSAAWPTLAREHEGSFRWPYLDHLGNVTVGIGLLIESGGKPTEECLRLPWMVDGRPATRVLIVAGWEAVNARTDLAGRAGQFEKVSRLRIDDQTIDAALAVKTREFWSILTAQLVDLEEWPADAQLALLDMAYQLGPRFMGPKWPIFTAAAHSSDFIKCSQNCSVRQASEARNGARIRWFQNAAQVEFLNLNPERLWDNETPKEPDLAAKVAFRGGFTCSCVATSLPWVEEDMRQRGIIKQSIDIAQLGWRGDVDKSAGTHDEGGCTDTWGQWNTEAIEVWRIWGWTMQRRDLTGVNTHAHGWPYGCPHLAPAAQAQARDWDRRDAGLQGAAQVAGRWPVKHWETALEEQAMGLIDDIADAVADKVIERRGAIADAVATRELKLSDKAEDAIAVRVRDRVLGDRVIPTYHPEPAGGWPAGKEPGPWTLHAMLRSIRQETNAAATQQQLEQLRDLVEEVLAAHAAEDLTE